MSPQTAELLGNTALVVIAGALASVAAWWFIRAFAHAVGGMADAMQDALRHPEDPPFTPEAFDAALDEIDARPAPELRIYPRPHFERESHA